MNAHADDGIKILYTDHCLFSFKLNNLIKNRISGLDAYATRQIEKNYFILSEADKYRIQHFELFMDCQRHKIQQIEVN